MSQCSSGITKVIIWRSKEGFPALLLDRIAYNAAGNPVEFCRSIVRGDRCRFYTDLM
ncbi:UTRA domain-containing protein [Virgibacillus halophilus]|uniref:UTRA domain-containing protein n=1 Tax=Tigheibacillus halophilus TaxID=361280 RepID=A0ABU5C3I8_9BACI|nr:UTRA domain-containing protein [Virgibacillus halophilus]